MNRTPYRKIAPIGANPASRSQDQHRTGARIERGAEPSADRKAVGPEVLVYVIRPNGTALYIPLEIAHELRVGHGAKLTPDQYESPSVQDLIMRRLEKETKKRACKSSEE